MKTSFAIMGIIAAVALVMSLAAPSAFALTQSSAQVSEQGSAQSQNGISVLSPQISKQISSQSSIQAACVYISIVCG